jgi:hypothetical protein
MLNLLSSTAIKESQSFTATRRFRGEGNCAWLARQLQAMTPADGKVPDTTYVVLLGGVGDVPFRIRVAQSHLRHDLKPSHWSHAVLLDRPTADVSRTRIYEISLEPASGFEMPTQHNGLQLAQFGQYDDVARYPNIAVLGIDVPAREWRNSQRAGQKSVLEQYKWQRAVLDAPDLMLSWLAFVWGVGRAGNPVLEGKGLPTAAMIETILNAVGFDLSPGLDTRVSCPESFWQAAKWWDLYYEGEQRLPITGRHHVSDRINEGV